MALSFFLLKPLLLYIALGFILAFIFTPVYNLILKATKSPTFSASLMCIILLLIIFLPIWFFTPMIIDQSLKIYVSVQQTDFTAILKQVFPSLFASDQFSAEVGGMIHSFITKLSNSVLESLSNIILNLPTLLLHATVTLFTFFFGLRDKDKLIEYLKSVSPFSKDFEDKLFKHSKAITSSVIYGHVIVGFIQGIVLAIGFFIFGIPNAWILSILGIIAGVLPLIGPMLIWVPVIVYLLIAGNNVAAIGILIIGLLASNLENVLRPVFISKRADLHSAVILIGMIGGFFMFGVLGLILGPLILAYLITIFEVYRDRGSGRNIFKD